VIDFGLVSLFAVQCALVGLVYHAWRGVKSEVTALLLAQKEIERVSIAMSALTVRLDQGIEIPKALASRVKEAEAKLLQHDNQLEAYDTKWNSLNGRVSAIQREDRRKALKEAAETEPASKEEGSVLDEQFPPVSSPETARHHQGIPLGFGKLKRRAQA